MASASLCWLRTFWLRTFWLLGVGGLLVLAAQAQQAHASVDGAGDGAPSYCPEELAKLSKCELDEIFRAAPAGPMPVGELRGRVLYLTDRCAQLKIRLANSMWKGKCFAEDGSFINRFLFFKALAADAHYGPSWLDGKECIVMEYPPNTPLFSNSRDELRELCPGLYLGRTYNICPCGELWAYFTLQLECKKPKKHCHE